MNLKIPKLLLATTLAFCVNNVYAQLANVSYQARVANVTSYCSGSSPCFEGSPTQEYTTYVTSYDNVNGAGTGTGCQTLDVGCDGGYAINFNLQSRINNSDLLFGVLDAWEDDCGTRCAFNTGVFLCGSDDCRYQPTNSYNFRAQSLPSNGTFTAGPTWGSRDANGHTYAMSCSWRYTGTTNLITPTCVTQTSNYSAGSVRSWSVNLTAGVSYNFNTCASSTSHDSRIRIYSSDGFTEVATDDDGCGGVLSNLDFIPATTGTYYVEVSQFTRANGLAAAGTLSYRINPPTTSTNGGNLIACQNAASASLNGSTPTIGTGTWTASSGTISFSNVNTTTATATGTTPGTYTLTWTINNGGCVSASTLQLTINSLSTAPTSILGTSTICAGGNTVLTVSGGSAGTGAVAQWFSGSCGGTAVGTGNSITVSPASTTTYFVRYGGICNTTTCASQVVTVNTLSTAPTSATATPTAVCAGSASTLNVVGGTLGTGATYRWYSGSCGGAAVGTGTSLAVSPATTTNYFVRLEGVCNTTTCASATLTVNPIPAAPAATNANVCVGDPQILTASGSGTIRWYNVSSGGAVIATGNTFDAGNPSPLPIGSYTYYVTEFNGTCESSPRAAVLLTVSAAPAAPTANGISVCPNASATLSASGSGAGFNWYNSAVASSPLATGPIFVTPALSANTSYWVAATNALGCAGARTQVDVAILNVPTPTAAPVAICPNTSASLTATAASATGYRWYANSDRTGFLFAGTNFNTPLLAATTTYYVSALYANGCESLLTPVTVTVNAAPTPPLANGLSSCDNINTILTAVGSGGTLSWFAVPTAGTILGTGTSYNAGILAANSYTFYVEESNGICNSNRTAVLVDVYNSPAAITTTNTTVCANNSAVLTATGAGVRWYADAALTNQIGSGNSFTTPILTTTTSYFAAVVNGNGCISPAATATATVNPTPATPTATGAAICAGNTATVTAVGAGGTLNWFSDATATSQIGTGASFTSPILTNNATYFVRETSAAGCNSATAAATITVNALPSAPTANATSVCESNALVFNGFGAGGTLSWFANATGGAALATGATYSVTPTAGNYMFYVSENNGTCNSNRTAVTGTVFANPAAITTTNTTVCANNSAVLTATGAGVRWYADAALTNQIGSGNSFTTPILTTTTSYFAAVVNGNGCISPAATATATVNPTPATPTATGAAICAGSTATVTAVGAGGTLNWFSDATATSQIGTGASFTSPILTNNATYFVRETSAAGCNSATAAATVTVNALPSAPTANATSVCEGNALIFNGFGAGGTLSWFANATGGAALTTGATYSVTPTAGNYTFYVSENNGTCNSNRTAVTGTVFANPAAITTTNTTVCANNSAVLTATGAGVRWYADAALTNQIGSGNSFTTPILTTTTSYFAAVVNGNGCISPAATATATVNPTPATPTATGAAICAGNTATVTAVGAGGTLNWFSDATATSQIGAGASFTSPILTNNATYFVRETSAAGCNSATAAATITVNALPSAPTANATSVCEGNALVFNGFGAGGTLSWFANATGGAALATGATYSVTPTVGNYTFYVSENNGTCNSNRTAVTGTVFANPAAITTTNTTVCANNSAVLTATGAGVRWYADAALTNQIGSGNSFTTPILTTTTSYFAAVVNGNGCISPAATATATVNPTPATPTATGAAICAGSTATVTAVGAGGTLNWFSDATATNQIGTGANFTSPILTNNATYFVRETSAAGCNSATASATITVNALPSAPTANATSVCEGNALIFNGFGAGGTLSWYLNSTTSVVTATGNSYNAGTLAAGNYTFFVSETVNGCASARVPAFGTVNPTPVAPVIVSNSPICEGEDLILQSPTTITGAVYTWTNVTPFSQTGQTIIIPEATAAQGGNYNLRVSLNGCNSPVVSTNVVVNAAPTLTGAIGNNSPLCETENLTLTAPSVANASFAWSGPNGFTTTGASVVINNVSENDQQGLFTVIATDNTTGCESNPLSTLVQINALPNAAFASSNSPLCAGSTLELMTQQVFGANYAWSGPNGFSSTDRNPLVPNVDSTYAGTYNVAVSIGNCAVTLSTNAVVNAAPATTIIADTSVRQGEVLQLFATGGTLFQWSPATYLSDANSPTPLFIGAPQGTYDYSVFITNALGCVLEKKVNIEVLPSLQPKFVDLFTPNNDGVNDTWEIGFLQNFAPYTLVVYSRGGLEVLRTENYANDWNGTQNGRELPDGTYWYVLRTQDREFSGAVTLKR